MRCSRAALALLSTLPMACALWPPEIDARCPSVRRGYDPGLTIVWTQPEGCDLLGEVGAESGRISSHWWWAREGDVGCARGLLSKRALAMGADTLLLDGAQRFKYAETKDPRDWVGGVVQVEVGAVYRCRK